MNEDYYHEQNSCYDPNSFGFDQFQPPQYTVNHLIFNAQNDLFNSQNKLMKQLTSICDMVGQYIQKKEEEKQIKKDQAAKARYWKILVCYDDDDEDYTIAITHKEPDNSLKIISMKMDPHHFNAESDLIESLLNRDSLIISSYSKTDCDPEEETRFIKRLLYDNSSPLPSKEFISKNSDAAFESFSPSPIPVEDSDSLMEEIDLSFTSDDPLPPGIKEDGYDSERDILILEELLSNDSLSLPKNESFHFDISSSSRPPTKPPDGNSGILNVKVMGDIFEHKTDAEGFCPPVFISSASLGNHDTPLFEGMIVAQQVDDVADEGATGIDVDDVHVAVTEPSIPTPTPTTQPPPPSQELPSTSQEKIAQTLKITKLKQRVKKLEMRNKFKVFKLRRLKKVGTTQRVDTSEDTVMDDVSKQGEIIANIDADEDVTLKDVATVAKEVVVEKNVEIEENADVYGRQAESQAQIYKIDLEHADKVLSMQDDELEPAEHKEVVTTAKLMTKVVIAVAATITVVDTPITAATITTAPSVARRRKEVVIRDPEETTTPSIIIHSEPKSKDKGKGIMVEEPKPLKNQAQKEQDEAYEREPKAELNKNINWDNYFNSNVAFLEKTKKQMEEEDNKALNRISESQAEKAAKNQKLDEEVQELKKHIQIVTNDEDDVYTGATPLARKVLVVDHEKYTENNKPYYKIIRADESHQLFMSFLSLLRNFDIEDLEVIWQLVKERFASSKPKNFSDDFLLTTLTYMFEKPDV
nr:hypothetical protein [Tanacetum cinerariifolium]